MSKLLIHQFPCLGDNYGVLLHDEASGQTAAIDAPDGQAALTLIESEHPDLVLTDLHMPGMNGLQLVAAVKDQFPLIPVILMTAKGSEEIAAEAMRKGAASYVPKRRLAEDLTRTVVRVLTAARENRVGAQLMHYMDSSEGHFTLHNDPPADAFTRELSATGSAFVATRRRD